MSKDNKAQRIHLLEELATLNGNDSWARSDNPVKKRIGRLEVAWREGMQWLMEDVQKMFGNFETVSDAYDIVDVNIATVKALCIDKGIFTEAEFKLKQGAMFAMVDRIRARKQQELDAALAAEKAKVNGRVPDVVPDKTIVDPALVKMREAAQATTDEDHVPKHATMFGG